MEAKRTAGLPVTSPLHAPPDLPGGRQSPPLRLPAPRPPVEDGERIVCSLPPARVAPVQALQVGRRRNPDLQRRLDLLASPGLPTTVRGLPATDRRRLRDRLLDSLLERDAALRPAELSRLMASAVHAWGAEFMPVEDLDAFLGLLTRAPEVHGANMWCALVDGMCRGLALDDATPPGLVESVLDALCQGAGSLEDPVDVELVMRRFALALGGPRLGQWMRARLVDALVEQPDLPVEQLGWMLLGLAVALEAAELVPHLGLDSKEGREGKEGKEGKAGKVATAGGSQAHAPPLPSVSILLAASLELSEPQLARWGQAIGVALRSEGEEGLAEIETALRECGGLIDTGGLTALACGLGSGLVDGCPDGNALLTLESLHAAATRLPAVGHRMALRRGLRLAADPIGASEGWDDRMAWLQAAWRLPGVVNARTAPRWFEQALALDGPAVERAHVLEALVVHGAIYLDDTAIRRVRDLALAEDPATVPGIYGAWIESGLPPSLFDGSLDPGADLGAERPLMARRLALVNEELKALPGLACNEFLRLRLRTQLTASRRDLQEGLATRGATQAEGFSGSPAAR